MTVLRVRVVGGDRQLARNELSVPSDWTVAQLASLLRRGLSAGAETSVAISLGGFGALLPPHQPLSSVHLAHARGGVLEVTYATSTQSIELSDILSSPADDLSSTQSAPHPLPEGQQGADISACTYLNRGGRRDDDAMAAVRPSNGGRVPRVVYAVLTLDMCAVGLVIPLLPTYCRMLGGDAAFAGVLQASYGLAQVAGASLLGGLSDRVGRRLILLLSLSGAIAGYAVIALSVRARASVWWLLLSRLPIGLTKQTVAVTRAMVSDCTILSTRAPALGRLAAAGGLGFVFGPAIGGILSAAISPLAPPLVAVGCFTLGLLLVATCLPETVPAVLAQSEFRACERAARELLEASARAHALNTCARTYARGGGDGSSGADGLGAFLARTAPVPLSGTDGSLLPVDSAEAIGRDAIRSWRADAPAAPLLRAADLDAALDVWARVLGQRASADGLVTSGECVAELERLYTQAKQAKGLLPSAPAEGALGRAPAPRSTAAAARTELTTSLCSIVRELRARPLLTELCAVRLLAEMAVLLVHNTFPSYADEHLGLSAKQTGYVMTLAAAMSVLVDIGVLPRLLRSRLLDVRSTALLGLVVAACSLPLCGAVHSVRALVGCLVVVSAGASLLRTALSTLMVNAVRRQDSGMVSGVIDSIESVCRVAAPLAGGMLLKHQGAWAPGAVGGCLAFIGAVELLTSAAPAAGGAGNSAKPTGEDKAK